MHKLKISHFLKSKFDDLWLTTRAYCQILATASTCYNIIRDLLLQMYISKWKELYSIARSSMYGARHHSKMREKIARKKDGTERVRKPVRLNGAALVYLPTWMWQGFWVVRIINRAGRWHLALDRTDWFTFITMNAGAVNCLIAPVSMLVSMSTSNDNQNRCCIRISPLHHPICNKSYFCSTSLMAVFSSTAADVHSWKVTYKTRQWLLVTRVSLTTVRVTWTAKGDLVQLWVRRALKFAKSGQHRKTVRSDVVADKMSTFYARFTVYVFCQKCDFWHGLIHGEQSGIERGG